MGQPRAMRRLAAALAIGAGATFALARVALPAPAAPVSSIRVRLGEDPAAGLGRPLGHLAPRRITIGFALRGPSPTGARGGGVRSWLAAQGFAPQRVGLALTVSASTSALGRLLDVSFSQYRVGRRRVFASSTPAVPATVAPQLAGIVGLSDTPAAQAMVRASPLGGRTAGEVAIPSACPSVVASAGGDETMTALSARYGISALLAAGDNGTGVRIAVVELAAFAPSDIATYDACFGLDPGQVSVVPIDGGAATGPGSSEAALDLEQLQTQAPGATILSYEAPDTFAGWYDALNAIVQADTAPVVSMSWGMCEALAVSASGGSAGAVAPIDALLARAAAQGQSVIVASGDRGAEDCVDPATGAGAGSLAVDFPASDPNVTAVGGTVGGAGGAETVWNQRSGAGVGGASGGGVSSIFPEPPWQSVVAGALVGRCGAATACRGTPDLSADASGIVFYAQGAWKAGSGTSFSAPLVAGMVADIIPTCAAPIGNLAPHLYAWAANPAGAAAIVPVLSGENDYTGAFAGTRWRAGGRYNLAAGLGTPVASALACPEVHTLSASTAPAGTRLTITGTALAGASVRVGARAAPIDSTSATSMVVTVPPGSGTVPLIVSNPTGPSRPVPFSYGALRAGQAAPGARAVTPSGTATAGTPGAETSVPGAAAVPIRVGGPAVRWVLDNELVLPVTCPEACAGTIEIRWRSLVLGRARLRGGPASLRVIVRLDGRGRRELAAAAGHRLLVRALFAASHPDSARVLVLREAPIVRVWGAAVRAGARVRTVLSCSLSCVGMFSVIRSGAVLGTARLHLHAGVATPVVVRLSGAWRPVRSARALLQLVGVAAVDGGSRATSPVYAASLGVTQFLAHTGSP